MNKTQRQVNAAKAMLSRLSGLNQVFDVQTQSVHLVRREAGQAALAAVQQLGERLPVRLARLVKLISIHVGHAAADGAFI